MKDEEDGCQGLVSFFLGIGEETRNEAEIRADLAGFIGDFEDFKPGNEGLQLAGNVYAKSI
jgi:hypothetical protein